MAISEDLRSRVKRKLRVTWEDEDTEARIDDVIADAAASLQERLGVSEPSDSDFEEAGPERELFLNLCFYSFNDAEDEFYNAYAPQILQCRRKRMVEQYEPE